jgi:hypothetical protein
VTVAPGEVGEVLLTLDPALADGPWTAELTLSSGLLERSASATVTFPAAGVVDEVRIDSGAPPWVTVLLVALGVLVVAVVILIAVLLRRRPGRAPQGHAE